MDKTKYKLDHHGEAHIDTSLHRIRITKTIKNDKPFYTAHIKNKITMERTQLGENHYSRLKAILSKYY